MKSYSFTAFIIFIFTWHLYSIYAICLKKSSLVGKTGDLHMVQHQLRGKVEILDDCTFKVFLLVDPLIFCIVNDSCFVLSSKSMNLYNPRISVLNYSHFMLSFPTYELQGIKF